MATYLTKRLLQALPLLLLVTIMSFAILHLAPGDPAALLLGTEVDAEDLQGARRAWGLDQPLHIQYFKWLGNLLHGDLGRSYATGQPTLSLISERIPATLTLTFSAFALALVVGLGLGVFSALRHLSFLDYLSTFLATTLYSLPGFWLALLLILVFSFWLGWLPSAGIESMRGSSSLLDKAAHLILPAFVLSLREMGRLIRFTRATLLEVLQQDYIRTAWAKGLPSRAVAVSHALRNALIPVITLLGLSFPHLLSGSVVIERVFAWPGMGQLMVDAAFGREYAILMGTVLLVGSMVVLGNLLADAAYALADPRVKYGRD